MSHDRDLDRTISISRGEVTVEKSFEPDEFPVPAVRFRIRSTSDEPVDIRLVDEIPDDFPMSAVGFHPEFESDNWTAYKDHRVEFERTLEPNEELLTVYGVRLDREEDAIDFLHEPELAEVGTETESVEDILGEDRNQPVRDVLAGDRESLPGMEVTDEVDSEPRELAPDATPAIVQQPPDAPDLGAEVARADEGETADGTAEEGSPSTGPETPASGRALGSESVAAVLAQELREGTVSEEDRETLREELDLGVPRSVDVRIKRLQSSVADLEAYSSALEEFLDEDGTARDIIDDFQDDIEALTETVEDLRDDVAAADAERGELADEVDELEGSLGDTASRVEDLSSDLTATESRVTTLDEEVGEVRGDVDDIDQHVADLEESLDAEIDSVRDDLEEELQEVQQDLREVRTDTRDDIEEIREEISDIHGEIETLDEFRDRLNRAFGGGMGGQPEE